jgi:lipoic acid synthetase
VDETPAAKPSQPKREPKPPWLKVRAPGGETYTFLKHTLRRLDLHTVCEEARCPNVGECWNAGTATVMVLGDTCTRGCRFCAVNTGNPKGMVDPREPVHVGKAIAELKLRYVVLTMVDRDDLLDGGASHVADTVTAIRELSPSIQIEALVSDFAGRHRDIETLLASKPDVFAHNLEVVRRVTRQVRDPRCSYDRSLDVLSHAKGTGGSRFVKSSLMVGAGETEAEVFEALDDLKRAQVDIVTLGQYLRPTPKHLPVDRYVTPEQFAEYEAYGLKLGFAFVASGPLVRSSYHAAEGFVMANHSPLTEATKGGDQTHDAPPRQTAADSPLLTTDSLIRKR